ncbi:hypothetical protein D6827_02415 [Candidatus Parcubacteria bacterium]|nr:MAG: hypothetical protein D6827_02415 [Candidatus Parcubacteria bacterium]
MSSQDIFYWVAAFAALWIAFFLSWLLYRIAALFKHISAIIEDVRSQMEKLENAVSDFKISLNSGEERLSKMVNYIKSKVSVDDRESDKEIN